MKTVLIVGGGSAGWIVATYLDAAINGRGAKRVKVTLVESEAIGRIGVGEATIPTLQGTLRTMGISEADFMRATSATFKHGIHFTDWAYEGHQYFHPFDRREIGQFDNSGVNWMFSDGKTAFADTVSMQPRLAEMGLATRLAEAEDFHGVANYAYHMDAEAFADYLTGVAVSRGVERIVDTVSAVDLDENGDIAGIRTKAGRQLSADLYVDCTGFASLLIEKTLKSEFVDFAEWLPCDRAVAMRVPYNVCPTDNIRPYTTSAAMPAGWRWDIGLQERRGTGYVYSSQFLSEDEAEQQLRIAEGHHAKDLPVKHLRFRTGHRTEHWKRNCVAIGLSSGFIEPLESTGIYLVEFAAELLAEYFPFAGDQRHLAARFNTVMNDRYRELLPFIALHYCLTKRTDTEFWRDVQTTARIPPVLRDMLSLWEAKPPSRSDFNDTLQLFASINYEYILFGMDWRPSHLEQNPRRLNRSLTVPQPVQQALADVTPQLLSHSDWLSKLNVVGQRSLKA